MAWRHLVLVVAAVPVAFFAVVAVEVQLARRGPMLGDVPLELSGRVGEATGLPLDVVWLGDSTAAGVGALSPAAALPTVVAAALDRPVDLTVLARSGATVADVVEDQLPLVAGLDPEVVFVSVGANDVTHVTGREAFERSYRRLVERLPPGAEVVMLGVPDMGAIPRLAQPLRALVGFRGRQLDEVVRDVAGTTGSTYVDIAGKTGPEFRDDPDRYFAADRYHPSEEGYRLWADAVLEAAHPASLGS